MKYRAILIPFLIFLSGAASLQANQWRNYTLKDGKFMIELPGEGTEQTQTFQSKPYGNLAQHKLSWEGDGYAFHVSYTSFPRWIFHQETISDFLAKEEKRMAHDFQGEISLPGALRIHHYPGRKFTTTIGSTGRIAQVRLYVVQNRLYTLIAESKSEQAYSYMISNFFESFKMGPSESQPEIKEHLDNLGYEYKIDENGRYKFTLFLSKERSQVVFISPAEMEITPQTHYLIWTPVNISKEMPDAKLANELLVENSMMEIGSFQVVKVNSGYLLIVSAKLSEGQKVEAFQKVIFQLTHRADTVEKQLSQKDKY